MPKKRKLVRLHSVYDADLMIAEYLRAGRFAQWKDDPHHCGHGWVLLLQGNKWVRIAEAGPRG